MSDENSMLTLKITDRGGIECVDIDDSLDGGSIALNVGHQFARRIIACVNLCKGTPTYRIEGLTNNNATLAGIAKRGREFKERYEETISTWTKTAEQGPDDECAVLMALSENEVWSGYRLDGQWHYVNGDPCCETPTHWMHLPRHPLDIAP